MRPNNVTRFFLAFAISSLLLAIPLAATTGIIAPAIPGRIIMRAEATTPGVYIPDRGDSLSVFFAGKDSTDALNCFALIHFDPMRQSLSVFTFPTDCMVDSDAGLMPLSKVFDNYGVSKAAEALSKTAGIYIGRSAVVSSSVFGSLIDTAGSVEMDLPVDIDVPEASASIEAGRQRMNGVRMIALMQYDLYPGGEAQRLELAAEAIYKLADKYVSGFGSKNGARLFTAFMNAMSNTNISMTDFEYRRPALEQVYEQAYLKPVYAPVSWNETDAGRFLTKESIDALKSACYPLEGW